MEKRYQVFVSSTYVDLEEERRAVIQALLELQCIPSGMELFPAADEEQWSLIRRTIDDCDYYIVIVGGRYGSIGKEGISYTEMEYDYAVEAGKPILGFVHEDPSKIPAGKVEFGAAARAKLEEFRAKVMTRMVRKFSSPVELASVVSRSLINLTREHPAEGWVRGRYAVSDEVHQELAQLRARVAETQLAEVRDHAAAVAGASDLAQGDDPVELDVRLVTPASSPGGKAEVKKTVCTLTWNEVIKAVGTALLNGDAASAECIYSLTKAIRSKVIDEPDERVRLQVSDNSQEIVRNQLQALQVIEIVSVLRDVSRVSIRHEMTPYWRLAPFGRALVLQMVALKKVATTLDAPNPGR